MARVGKYNFIDTQRCFSNPEPKSDKMAALYVEKTDML